jgi:endonuclease/exonuclease/phosphatase family metal-dependent hydrolase
VTFVRQRPFRCLGVALVLYLLVGLRVSGVRSLDIAEDASVDCPAVDAGADAALTVLQGNLWMLPARPLLAPFAASTDRGARLERLVHAIRTCQPAVVILQEVFDRSMVALIAEHLPDYRAVSSGKTDFTRTMNASGLLTLTRLPVEDVRYRAFSPLPSGSRFYEVMARKGVLAVDVDVGGFAATILNVHLYGARVPADVAPENRRKQLDEVLALAREMEAQGRRVLVGGDFNLPREQLALELPDGWRISQHGPTYDPAQNPYTGQGPNKYLNQDDRAPRTIDFLLTAPGAGLELSSQILTTLVVSDHELLHHVVVAGVS